MAGIHECFDDGGVVDLDVFEIVRFCRFQFENLFNGRELFEPDYGPRVINEVIWAQKNQGNQFIQCKWAGSVVRAKMLERQQAQCAIERGFFDFNHLSDGVITIEQRDQEYVSFLRGRHCLPAFALWLRLFCFGRGFWRFGGLGDRIWLR